MFRVADAEVAGGSVWLNCAGRSKTVAMCHLLAESYETSIHKRAEDGSVAFGGAAFFLGENLPDRVNAAVLRLEVSADQNLT